MKQRHNSTSEGRVFLKRRGRPLLVLALLGVGLSACGDGGGLSTPSFSSITTMFDKPQEKLPGRRVSVLKSDEKSLGSEAGATPVVLPPAYVNAAWSQPGGIASNAPGHLVAGSTLQTLWSSSAGEGSDKRARITAVPIVYQNKIFTIDAEGNVRGFSTANGEKLWSVSLLPDSAKESWGTQMNPFKNSNNARAGFGGGLAADGGKLFVASGFGTVVALEPGSGKVLWTRKFEVPFRQAPTAADGRLFVVNSDSEVFCFSEADGKDLWSSKGLPENASLISNASPAVVGNMVIVPYPSGEISAYDVATGQSKWTDTLQNTEINSSATSIGDAARPVIDRDLIFAMNRMGQLVATSKDKGKRVWAREISGSQMPWVAGDGVFVVDATGKLVALNRKDGRIRWVTALPDDGLWSGPVLGSGKLWLTSAKGKLLSVDAVTGTVANQTDIGDPITIPPIVAEGRLYVLTNKAKIIAIN